MKGKIIKTRKREPMVDKELIGIWKKVLKPSISSWLLKTNYEGLGEQDKEEFERDFDEILDLALIGLNASGESKPMSDLIERQAAIDLLSDYANTVSLDENLDVNAKIAIQLGITNCIGIVNHDIPSVQPERKTGYWIAPKYYPTQFTYTCSKCGYKQSFNGKFKFCPNCGADMRGEQRE